jgi:NAD+ synthase (glutamine-hydrolysing)
MKNKGLRISIAQVNLLVGDITGNAQRIIASAQEALKQQADVLMLPELALTGYPSLAKRVEKALAQLLDELPPDLYVLLGYPRASGGKLYNAAGVLHRGEILAEYFKQELPNYQVFDEKRYFAAGDRPCVLRIKGVDVAISVCEDIWHPGPMAQASEAGAGLMLNINASPFHRGKQAERLAMLAQRTREGGMPIVYANLVGGQDELVFDGGSLVVDGAGTVVFQAPLFEEGLFTVDFDLAGAQVQPIAQPLPASLNEEASVYQALVVGVRDYINKNGFKGAVLGLSGGIDSALTLAVAVDAIGSERVEAVMMPFRYTAQMSLDDAEAEAQRLGVTYHVRNIAPMYEAFMQTLAEDFRGTPVDKTEENLQARCRGVLLMAISNKKGFIVLTTGNKSEMAVGYATLYGDMAGGFDVLKDVPKTLVFRLAEYRNQLTPENPPIPQRVIDRPPSAELAPDQKDEDSLPPYPVLDAILAMYIENDMSANDIVAQGYDEDTVKRVVRMVDFNEYKRRQAAVGVRITPRGFGRDRRYPITCRWPAGE